MSKLGPLTVSRQGFGAMGLSSSYGRAEDAESIKTLHRAIELGVTLFDTATGYGAGHNETLLGQAIADRREGLVVSQSVNPDWGMVLRMVAAAARRSSFDLARPGRRSS